MKNRPWNSQSRSSNRMAVFSCLAILGVFMGMPVSAYAQASVGVYVTPNGDRGLVFTTGSTRITIPVGGADPNDKLGATTYEDASIFNYGASGYVYNFWEDKDGDGKNDGKKEYVGLNKMTYHANESLYMRLSTKYLHGHSATMVLLSPANKIVWHEQKRIDEVDWYRWLDIGKGFAERTIANYGEGTYRAIFIVDDTCINVSSFMWLKAQ